MSKGSNTTRSGGARTTRSSQIATGNFGSLLASGIRVDAEVGNRTAVLGYAAEGQGIKSFMINKENDEAHTAIEKAIDILTDNKGDVDRKLRKLGWFRGEVFWNT